METVSLVGEWLGVALAIASVLNGVIPSRYHSIPVVGLLLKAINFAAATTPPDAQGTFKLPGKRIVIRVESDPPKPPVPPLPLLLLLTIGLVACPGLPPPDGCRPGTVVCKNDTPYVCSQTQRLTQDGLPCASVGATCCLTKSAFREVFIYACVPQSECESEPLVTDAGAQ